MADFSYKKIKDVVAGDKILSYNDEGLYEVDEVVKQHQNLLKSNSVKMYRLEFDNGVELKVTGNHMIMTDKGYIRADELNDEKVIGV
jgi:intein/homing endonuclease